MHPDSCSGACQEKEEEDLEALKKKLGDLNNEDTLWSFDVAMGNHQCSIDKSLSVIYKWAIFHSYVQEPGGISTSNDRDAVEANAHVVRWWARCFTY